MWLSLQVIVVIGFARRWGVIEMFMRAAEAKSADAAQCKGEFGAAHKQVSTPAPSSFQGYVRGMQQTLGNQAVQHLLRTHVLQTKLVISRPGDEYEQEADRVADTVMRAHLGAGAMGTAQRQNSPQVRQLTLSVRSVQRCSCDSENATHRCDACNAESLQTKSDLRSDDGNEEAPQLVQAVLGSSGQPLHNGVREEMESRFGGHDFRDVQVHADSRAADSARAVRALAYTVGNHVVFGEGQYSPSSASGQQLLAHELVHVLQQRGNRAAFVQSKYSACTTGGAPEAEPKDLEGENLGRNEARPVGISHLYAEPVLRRAYDTPQKANETRTAAEKRKTDIVNVTRLFEPCPCKTVNEKRTGIFYNSDLRNAAIAYRHCSGGVTKDVYAQMQSNLDAFLQGAPPQATAKIGIDINMVGKVVSGRVILEPLATTQPTEKGIGVHGQVVFEGGKWRIYLDSQYIRDLQSRAGGASLDHLDVTLGGQFGKISAQVVAKDLLSPGLRTEHMTLCFGDQDICPFVEVGPNKQFIIGGELRFGQKKVRKDLKCTTCLCPPPVKKYECDRYGQTESPDTTEPLRYYFDYDSTSDTKVEFLQEESRKTLNKVGEYLSHGYRIARIAGYASPENIKPRYNEKLSQNRADKLASILADRFGPRAEIPAAVGAGELVGRKPAIPGQNLDDIARAAGFPSAEKVTELLTGAETLRPELVGQFLSLFQDPRLSDSGKITFFGFSAEDPIGPKVLEAVQEFVSSKGKDARRWNHIFPLLRYSSVVLTGKKKEEAKVGVGASERLDDSECAEVAKKLEESKSFGEIDKAAAKPTVDPDKSDDECAGISHREPPKGCDYTLPKEHKTGHLPAPDIAPERLQSP